MGGYGVAGRCGWRFFGRSALVVSALAPQTAVGVAFGLLVLVVTVFNVGFEVVLLDPGDDVLGVQGDALPKIVHLGA